MNTRLARATELQPTALPAPEETDELDVRRRLGTGELAFARAKERLATWGTHRSRWMAVDANGRSDELRTTVLLGVGIGLVRLWFGCRVVEVIDEARLAGFEYATLPGHPERGVERFTVTLGADGAITGRVQAWSRPAHRALALAGPAARLAQRVVAAQYLRRLSVD